jgi:hypothetical protein
MQPSDRSAIIPKAHDRKASPSTIKADSPSHFKFDMSSGWITKEDAASASSSTQQGTGDLASRLGGFGLQDKANSGSQAATTNGTAAAAAPSPAPTGEKPQTVPDGWSAPAAAPSSSTPSAPAAVPATTTPAAPTAAPVQEGGQSSAEQDAIAAAEKEAQEMSHEDGRYPASYNSGSRSCLASRTHRLECTTAPLLTLSGELTFASDPLYFLRQFHQSNNSFACLSRMCRSVQL